MTECTSRYIFYCNCPSHKEILIAPSNGVFYPSSSLLMAGGSLRSVVSWNKSRHYAEAVINAVATGRAQKSASYITRERVCYDMCVTFTYESEGLMEIVGWTMFPCNRQALRVQRWFKRMIFRMHAPRRLALAMALHPSLGKESLLGALLCSDLLGMVAFA